MIYLDHSATTPVLPEAMDLIIDMMQYDFFNPSAMYTPAIGVEKKVRTARRQIAKTLQKDVDDIFFTSGGTESNNMAIMGTLQGLREQKYRFVCSPIEHSAVLNVMLDLEKQGHELEIIPVDEQGSIDLMALEDAIDEKTALVSIMHVNNEIGTQQDMIAIADIIHKKNEATLFHSDGVQAFGKMALDSLPVDYYSLSGHKFYAPKGIGALYIKKGTKNAGGQRGGGQERNMRSGTLNTAGIMGMAKAVQVIEQHQFFENEMRVCKETLASDLLTMEDVFVNGPSVTEGVAHILNLSFVGVRGEVLLHALEEREIYVSTGSACSSHQKTNRIQRAIGLSNERGESAIRFSFGFHNTVEQMHEVAQQVCDIVAQLRRFKRK